MKENKCPEIEETRILRSTINSVNFLKYIICVLSLPPLEIYYYLSPFIVIIGALYRKISINATL
jgi:hypothetical protein